MTHDTNSQNVTQNLSYVTMHCIPSTRIKMIELLVDQSA